MPYMHMLAAPRSRAQLSPGARATRDSRLPGLSRDRCARSFDVADLHPTSTSIQVQAKQL